MNAAKKPLRLFEGYGIEVEYMIASRDSCEVMPIADKFLKPRAATTAKAAVTGVEWSNELASHVVEAKCSLPAPEIEHLHEPWLRALAEAGERLSPHRACLLPSAAHPWMNPKTDTFLWRHEGHEIYEEYDRIFGCDTHGWTNLQSIHINLPFSGDDEFARLHAAIRVALPIIPALAAASPYLDGAYQGLLDARMSRYLANSLRVPSMTGPLIPEPVYSQSEYVERILKPIYRETTELDAKGVLRAEWANARAAIARFDRMAIEIRAVDSQESALADLAVARAISKLVYLLTMEELAGLDSLKSWNTQRLRDLFLAATRDAENTPIKDAEYAAIFGLEASHTMGDIWRKLLDMEVFQSQRFERHYQNYRGHGTLATRLLRKAGTRPDRSALLANLHHLRDCLANDNLFTPGQR